MNRRSKKQKKRTLKAIDFFCGAGGVTSGFRKAGIKVLAGIDSDLNCRDTYEKNNPGSKFIHKDISCYPVAQLKEETGITREDDRLIFIGCSPCQYYTILQTTKKKSSNSKLLLEDFRKFVSYYMPGYIFIENVPGLETKRGTPLQRFKDFIKARGYVFDEEVVNATSFGVPQNRRRYVLIATRVKDEIKVPTKSRVRKKPTVRNFISQGKGFPRIGAGHHDLSRRKHTTAKLKEINLKRIKKTPINGGTRHAWKNNAQLQLPCYDGKDDLFADVYGRMFWDRPSPTITTKFFSISNGRFGHPSQHRAISLREGATLQSFPRSYVFHSDGLEVVARMIGNAVPPRMAEKIGAAIIRNHRSR